MKPQDIIKPFISRELTFNPGETIFAEGSPVGHVFVIMKGKVRIKKKSVGGLVTLSVLGAGSMLGETSFFDKAANLRSATAVAETEARIGILAGEKIEEELSKISSIHQEILGGLARRIRITTTNAALMAGD